MNPKTFGRALRMMQPSAFMKPGGVERKVAVVQSENNNPTVINEKTDARKTYVTGYTGRH